MKSPEELTKDAMRGEKARQIIEDPLVREVLDDMRADVFNNFRTSIWYRKKEREALFKMIRAIDDFESRFKKRMEHGKKAKSLLEKLFNKGE